MTNNLLDEQYHPEIAASVRVLAKRAGELVSLSPHATEQEAIAPYARRVAELGRDNSEPDPAPHAQEAHCAELPDSVSLRLDHLLGALQEDAKQLAGCAQFGEETAWQWWENRFEAVVGAIDEVEELCGQATEAGVDLTPHIDARGGVPVALTREHWPADLVRAYQEHDEANAATPGQAVENVSEEKQPGGDASE